MSASSPAARPLLRSGMRLEELDAPGRPAGPPRRRCSCPCDQHRQALGLEPLAAAGLARLLDHELLERRPHRVAGWTLGSAARRSGARPPSRSRTRLRPRAPSVWNLKRPGAPWSSACCAAALMLAPGRVEVELERLGERREHDLAQVAGRLAPGQDHALEDRDAGIAEHQLGVHLAPGADAVAVGAGAERRVEGELARLELGERECRTPGRRSARRSVTDSRSPGSVPYRTTSTTPSASLERGLDRVGEPRAVVGADHQPVDHDRDVVVLAPVERRRTSARS